MRIIKLLFKYGSNINETNKIGYDVLMLSMRNGSVKLTDMLCKTQHHNITDINKICEGNSYLELAIISGSITAVKMLVSKKVGINKPCSKFNRTPLHDACDTHNVEIVEFLLRKGANIHTLAKDLETPLHTACRKGNEKIIKLLIQYGARVNDLSIYDDTPLMMACRYNYFNIVKLLVKTVKILDINMANNIGVTALKLAITRGFTGMVTFLVNNGANVHKISKFKSPLAHAVERNKFDIVNILLKHGADPDR